MTPTTTAAIYYYYGIICIITDYCKGLKKRWTDILAVGWFCLMNNDCPMHFHQSHFEFSLHSHWDACVANWIQYVLSVVLFLLPRHSEIRVVSWFSAASALTVKYWCQFTSSAAVILTVSFLTLICAHTFLPCDPLMLFHLRCPPTHWSIHPVFQVVWHFPPTQLWCFKSQMTSLLSAYSLLLTLEVTQRRDRGSLHVLCCCLIDVYINTDVFHSCLLTFVVHHSSTHQFNFMSFFCCYNIVQSTLMFMFCLSYTLLATSAEAQA